MRNLSPALTTHIAREVTSLVACVEIRRNDGVIIRMTEGNRDITVDGDVYESGATFNLSALKSSSDLSVDNASMDIGVDGTRLRKSDFDRELMRRAPIYVFLVNWQSPSDGVIPIKRGWVGDVTRRDQDWVTISLRGLTQALQRNILEQYSPTCRADFGDARCGVATSPTQIWSGGKSYKIGDWVVDNVGNETNVPFPNPTFDLGLASWSTTGSWTVVHDMALGYYATVATPDTIWQTMMATVAGMSATLIDNGAYAVTLRAKVSGIAHAELVFYDNAMMTVGGGIGSSTTGDLTWQEAAVSALVPKGTRHVKFSVVTDDGDVKVDDVTLSFADVFPSVIYKAARIPGGAVSEELKVTNYRFCDDGLVNPGGTITGWSGTGFKTDAVSPYSGAYSLKGTTTAINTTSTKTQTVAVTGHDGHYMKLAARLKALDAVCQVGISLTFKDVGGATLSTLDSGLITPTIVDTWQTTTIGGLVPTGTTQVDISLYGRTGASSADLNVGFDDVHLTVYNTALPAVTDLRRGNSGLTRPSFDATPGAVTPDGDVIWIAVAAPFGFDTVNAVTDQRVFTGTSISGGQYDFFTARILWLTGANAGRISYVRSWIPGSKTLKLYTQTGAPIVAGDRFLYTSGCGKTIEDCKTRFNNAINFRGEPYLPGNETALTYFTGSAA